ncbi:hypothetical protein HK098_003931 [Nowakowskiella sp. JEL0407]|nr:hypothetical protein HK098_003931 [Nowakowskiella sp. JEL0407]
MYDDNFEIPRESVQITSKLLGSGTYAEVKLGIWTGTEVAVKIFKGYEAKSHSNVFRQEITNWQKLNHRHILHLYGYCFSDCGPGSDNPPMIIMELAKCSLGDRLKQQPKMSFIEKIRVLKELSSGLCHVHGKKIIHGDLKSSNVMLDHNDVVKLADFGLSGTQKGTLTISTSSAVVGG